MGYGLYALPGETWLCCHRPRMTQRVLHEDTCHQGVRPARFRRPRRGALVSRARRVHRIRLNVRDDRNTSLSEKAGRGVCTRELG